MVGVVRRVLGGAPFIVIGLVLAFVAGSGGGAILRAQEAPAAVGELVLPSDGQTVFSRLFAPSSGALFALAPAAKAGEQARLIRSDDGGTTWREVALPPPPPAESERLMTVVVDPLDHTILYAIAAEGLYKSDDDGASWRPIFVFDEPGALVAVSPADHQLIYLRLATVDAVQLLRSPDGGDWWEVAYSGSHDGAPCSVATLLVPHPSDPERVVGNVSCEAQTEFDLFVSGDRGASWAPFLKPRGPDVGPPVAVIGGSGARPERLYVGFAQHYLREQWLHLDLPLYRSDDGGQTWSTRIIAPFAVSGPKSQSRNPSSLQALAYDPANPDRVYAGLVTSSWSGLGALQASADGGQRWSGLDVGGALRVSDVALGIDGLNLYAATEKGIYRVRL